MAGLASRIGGLLDWLADWEEDDTLYWLIKRQKPMSLNKSLSMPKQLITGQSAWYGRDLLDSTDWVKF